MEQDEVIAEALGDHVYSHYLEAKREEWDEYNTADHRLGARPLPRGLLAERTRIPLGVALPGL